MNVTVFFSGISVNQSVSCVHGKEFTNAILWGRSALLPVICAGFSVLRDSCALLHRMNYLLPHANLV